MEGTWLNAVVFSLFCLLCLGASWLVFVVCETMKQVLTERSGHHDPRQPRDG